MYGIAIYSIVPMRKDASEKAEMVSQLLFGESYKVVSETEGFLQVTAQYDDYTGWIGRALHYEITENYYTRLNQETLPVQTALLMNVELRGKLPQMIVAGSTLPGFDQKKELLEIENEVFQVRWTFGKIDVHGYKNIPDTAAHFLNTPYLWGGRSMFGCDCSGFIQMVYKIHGIKLRRDSHQQAEQGEPVTALSNTKPGDLAFFAGENGRVNHVGMITSPGEIIHSSGYVHRDRLDEKGIFSNNLQRYTHSLFCIRRIIP